ncbi:class I adenylate-forming enzyme family protein [Myxococcota bacterium]
MIITEILARNCRMYGDEIALVELEPAKSLRREITWREFDDLANRVAQGLIARGVGKDDKVVLLLTNCLEWLPIYFGILKSGAWAVPLSFRFTSDDICLCTNSVGAKALIFGEEFVERVTATTTELDSIDTYVFLGARDSKPDSALPFEEFLGTDDEPQAEISLLDTAAVYFTSGTTGKPKPIRLTHRNLEFACVNENRHHNQTHEDNFLCIPPLFHTGAKMHWFGNLIVGGKGVILRGIRPQWILEAISEEKVTVVFLLVPWAQDILVAIESDQVKLSDYALEQWRVMHIGAQPVPPSLINNWRSVFPHHLYDTNYGLSETTGPGCVHLGFENSHKVGSIGLPGFDWECRIVNEQLSDVPVGERGELIVKGPGVMKEYFNNPEATREALRDGWLLTGDMARRDEDGFIWLVDRKKDIIIVGGENVFPVEIEDFLRENDAVQDAAVIGIPDRRLGEVPAAVIKTKPGKVLSEEEILELCKKLPKHKRPKRVFFADVPRNPTGKIEKPKLRKIFGDHPNGV